ncbi:NAD-dependent epimerase [Marinobacterium aestuariivivens]|uniref:NAD-dependent epimerase n=1 Tax=Marinobacterium aestuariivivens TaxID=1698799 RepID=A0ABW1ZWL0_9GAMM
MKVLVTGVAGFIGFHVAQRLLASGCRVTGLDNLNDYYDPALKRARLSRLDSEPGFSFVAADLADRAAIAALFEVSRFDRVVHLAAQAGVRYSLDNPRAYVDANLAGLVNILEGCRAQQLAHLVYASSSSVYGLNTRVPFREEDAVDHPVSLYAASKKSGELLVHSYSHLYGLPSTGLRFFTVYGPWGRPDMAPIRFARAISAGDAIDVYNRGQMSRDFTYIDDIVEGVVRVMDTIPQARPGWTPETGARNHSSAPYAVYNIGAGQPVGLMDFIRALEEALGLKARMNLLPMQPGDVPHTWASTQQLFDATGFRPCTGLDEGVERFVSWFREYYG